MGISGTDVAKGAAAMILTDDNFATIEAAVAEGRGVFDNLTKFIVWIIPTNLGEALMLLSTIILGLPLPLVPLQLLWINLTDTLLGLSLAFEPKEGDVMSRMPRDQKQPLLTFPLIMRTGLVSLVMVTGGLPSASSALNERFTMRHLQLNSCKHERDHLNSPSAGDRHSRSGG
jgi:Ca2+-transporting ATPase